MPNWIEGTMKIRGKYEDIRKFIEEGLEPCVNFRNEPVPKKEDLIVELCGDYSITEEVHVSGTRRAFVQSGYIYLCQDEAIESVAVFDIKQAWAFIAHESDNEKWKAISDKFNVDIKLYGIEQGMEFCQEVIIVRGRPKVIENVTEYEDWDWECPFPRMGG